VLRQSIQTSVGGIDTEFRAPPCFSGAAYLVAFLSLPLEYPQKLLHQFRKKEAVSWEIEVECYGVDLDAQNADTKDVYRSYVRSGIGISLDMRVA
jgi:hypothetical protein